MTISNESLARKTLEIRLKVHELVSGGMSESQAMIKVLPDDKNRSRRMKGWIQNGLWPISEHELTQMNTPDKHTTTQTVNNETGLYDVRAHTITQQNTPNKHSSTQSETKIYTQIEISDLREMIQQIVNETISEKLGNASERLELKVGLRPIFRRENTIARSIRLGKGLSERSEKKAKQDRAVSGGTLNGLVEYLLWQYLGKPDDLIIGNQSSLYEQI